jgi:hypothetical protein
MNTPILGVAFSKDLYSIVIVEKQIESITINGRRIRKDDDIFVVEEDTGLSVVHVVQHVAVY